MLFKPNLGEEFPLDVKSLNARRSLLEEITRSRLTAWSCRSLSCF
jgi:hypothetical protein